MALEGSEGSASCPGRSLSPGKTQDPLYRRLGGPQGRSGQVRKNSPQQGFDLRTVQPVASRYTDYATRPTKIIIRTSNKWLHISIEQTEKSPIIQLRNTHFAFLTAYSPQVSLLTVRGSYPGRGKRFFLNTETSRWALGPTQPTLHSEPGFYPWGKSAGRDFAHLRPSTA